MRNYFKHQYLEDIKLKDNPYLVEETAIARSKRIYDTRRQPKLPEERAPLLWSEVFQPIYESAAAIPLNQEYDQWHQKEVKRISGMIHDPNSTAKYKLGLAQKYLNLFIKDLCAFDVIPDQPVTQFHFPLDGVILGKVKLKNQHKAWKSWTKVVAESDDEFNTLYKLYMDIQALFRTELKGLTERGMDLGTLDLEQIYWHSFSVG